LAASSESGGAYAWEGRGRINLETTMARFGAFCFPGSGHINPMTALAHALERCGHSVVIFGIPDTGPRIRAAGIEFHAIGESDFPLGTLKALDDRLGELSGLAAFRFTVERVRNTGRMVLRDAPSAIREARIDALLVDETDVSGTVAEHLGIPFVSIAIVPPILDDNRIPPFFFAWQAGQDRLSRFRNYLGRKLARWIGAPILNMLNQQRIEWGLKPFRRTGDSLSRIAQIAQMPSAFEFESAPRSEILHYTGPWVDAKQRPPVDFPWQRLDGRPLAYASLGTLQNGADSVFRTIAEACAQLPVQLVMSLGGGLEPERFGNLPGDPLVVPFAPQLELIKRARVVITHAGINTALESLAEGVPFVAIPIGNDQPGVAARAVARGVAVMVPQRRLTASRLRRAVQTLLEDDGHRLRAQQFARAINQINGPALAAEIIEQSLQLTAVSVSARGSVDK
jgi:zeaxanthin glucosyltransferase